MRKYIKEGYDYKEYQKELDDLIKNSSLGRKRVCLIAFYMVSKFPKIPYFWGGGHSMSYEKMIGLDPELGKMVPIKIKGSKNMLVGDLFPKSYDCSGFVSWCLINGGFNLNSYIIDKKKCSLDVLDFLKIGEVVSLENEHIQKGDLVWMEGHIGIIVNVTKSDLAVAHLSYSGKGTNFTIIDRKTCRITKDDIGEMDEESETRIGQKYFEKAICLNY